MTLVPATTALAHVAIVAKDPTITRALAGLLALDPEIDVVAEAETIAGLPHGSRPDLIIIDSAAHHLPPVSQTVALEALRSLTIDEALRLVKDLIAARGGEPERHLRPVAFEQPVHGIAALSDRELQVVRLVAEGLSNKEISARLSLSDKTVKNHVSHILSKMNLTARTQVAVHAIRAGIV